MAGRWLRFSSLMAVAALVTAVACSSDSSAGTASPPAAATSMATETATNAATEAATVAATATEAAMQEAALSADFCSALVVFDQANPPGGEEDEAAYVAAIQEYAGIIEGPLATMSADAPAEAKDALATLTDLLPRLHEGDIAAYESPEGSIAIDEVEQAAAAGCGWQTVQVTATDYHFEPDQTSLAAGPISFRLTNQGQEPHVFLLLKKQDGDTRELTDIVGEFLGAMFSGDPSQMAAVADEDVPGGGPFAMPGTSGSHVLDLSAGTYVYWCPIPQGESGNGPPHFTLGMIGEITVN